MCGIVFSESLRAHSEVDGPEVPSNLPESRSKNWLNFVSNWNLKTRYHSAIVASKKISTSAVKQSLRAPRRHPIQEKVCDRFHVLTVMYFYP